MTQTEISEVTVPELGKVDQVSLVEWKVSVGDEVEKDSEVAEIETMKATFSVEAGARGVIKEILVEQGETVDLNQTLATIESP